MKHSDDKRNTIDDTPLNGSVFCLTQLSEGWYRFVTAVGTRTLTTCVDGHKCGEVNLGWLTLDSQRQLTCYFSQQNPFIIQVMRIPRLIRKKLFT